MATIMVTLYLFIFSPLLSPSSMLVKRCIQEKKLCATWLFSLGRQQLKANEITKKWQTLSFIFLAFLAPGRGVQQDSGHLHFPAPHSLPRKLFLLAVEQFLSPGTFFSFFTSHMKQQQSYNNYVKKEFSD